MKNETNYQNQPAILCLSHLRWNFVFQRPQHLMSRFAKDRLVYFVEEPVYHEGEPALKTVVCPQTGVNVVTPHLRNNRNTRRTLERLLTGFVQDQNLTASVAWFYTPMALQFFPKNMNPAAIVYDCMDELSMFRNAPSHLVALEKQLLRQADVVFTGGVSLFEAKRSLHRNIHAFPSGVDVHHFQKARGLEGEYREQQGIARPRLGFAGVIDERMDLELIGEVARRRPEWQLIMIGPTAKIAPEALPRESNIHWLGMRDYKELPHYFAGWDVAIMPFALNDSTRFISPTKTPEFLVAGLPVVSTPIRDVVRPYGELGMVRIAATPEEFIEAVDCSLAVGMGMKWRERADEYLKTLSWDSVWDGMNRKLTASLRPEKTMTAGSGPLASAVPGVARV